MVGATLKIGNTEIAPGERVTLELPLPELYTHAPMAIPVVVARGRRDGPRLFVSAAIHGDELNGVEIVRRLLRRAALRRLRGTLIAVPMVNVYGVIQHSRYLPDRRDLNRAFPGSERGSLASRLAYAFMTEIVANATHGIDLHTGAFHRENLPQIRGRLDDAETGRLARAFGVPVLINSDLRDGSLREAAAERDMPMLLYEAGQALRFDEFAIRAGVQGVINVMRALDMLPASRRRPGSEPFVARSSTWVRAPRSGVLRGLRPLGAHVERESLLGIVSDPFGESETPIHAPDGGIVIGCTHLPLVHEGEAVLHLARFADAGEVAGHLEVFQTQHEDSPPAELA
jgi:predicted deacylase